MYSNSDNPVASAVIRHPSGKWIFILSALAATLPCQPASAQTSGGGPMPFTEVAFIVQMVLMGIALIVLILILADRLVKFSMEKVAAGEVSGDPAEQSLFSLFPSFGELFGGSKKPAFLKDGGKYIELKRGFNINIKGKPQKVIRDYFDFKTATLKPVDFHGIAPIPKLFVNVGDEVLAGDPVYYDKKRPEIHFTSPVSGEVIEIRRGEKRAITEIVILVDREIRYKDFGTADPNALSREEIIRRMLESGTWTFLRQRPFNLLADPEETPKAIFISGFDTAPLAPDLYFVMHGQEKAFQAGIDALRKLTDGKVHLNLKATGTPPDTYLNARGVQINCFKGIHPAGCVGVQIHHIDPIGKNDIVWTIQPQDVVILGRLFLEGRFNAERIVALGGCEVKNPGYYRTITGASIEGMVKDNLLSDHVRYISGDVLTGRKIEFNGHLGWFDDQVTVIEEGDFYEFMGWLLPSYPRPSMSKTFPWAFFPFEEFHVNTNMHGEQRAFVMTGQYEKVVPMDLYPVQLLKSILYNDLDEMEGLGIYEVVEEDLALCEFVCTSKQPVQRILREGMNKILEQY